MIGGVDALLEEGELLGAISSMAPDDPLWASCEYIVSNPGKRFRASVLINAAQYGSSPHDALVKQSALAVEAFHAATLAHDDVVDDGKLRRGKLAIGASAGNLAASFAGGWLLARAIELVADLGDEATDRFAQTVASVCEGEMLETRDLLDVDRDRERYLITIKTKTASLLAFAAWLGARAGGAAPQDADKLYRYGEAVGMAFQLADDVLDLIADPKTTGKTAGSDLRQGVYTLPIILALEVDPSLREALMTGPDERELALVIERVCATGAIDAAIAECCGWAEQACSALPRIEPFPDHAKRLSSLAGSVVHRVGGPALC